jgi:hypothetical protein
MPTLLRSTAAALSACLLLPLSVPAQQPATATPDPVAALVGRLSLDRYKATIKGLTQFGDRRQGTARNRAAVDWIEAQLKSYGCSNTERITYTYDPTGAPPSHRYPSQAHAPGVPVIGPGGARERGVLMPDTVNNDPLQQPDLKLRALDTPPSVPGERQEVYCTKIGSTHPDQMYIVGAHMDGIGWGEAADDDGSGTALVMELARVFSSPDVTTDVSIRFALWNNEETGLNGATAYVTQRKDLQGKESPAGSGKYPEPRWLGMVQHDMVMFDHGMPHPDGTMSPQQRPEADINVEYQVTSKFADQAMSFARAFQLADDKYATDYPAAVGPHMTNTDSTPFMNLTPSLSVREIERGSQMAAGWNPNHHHPTDVYAHYTDDDFRLGLNSAQTTLGAIGTLAGAKLTPAR